MKRETIEMNLLNAGCDAKVLRINSYVKCTLVFARIIGCLNICPDNIKRETGAFDVLLSFEHGELNLSLFFKKEDAE